MFNYLCELPNKYLSYLILLFIAIGLVSCKPETEPIELRWESNAEKLHVVDPPVIFKSESSGISRNN